MTSLSKLWEGELVRKWLERRFEASQLDQAVADRLGYEARDDYDKAAAEEWAPQFITDIVERTSVAQDQEGAPLAAELVLTATGRGTSAT